MKRRILGFVAAAAISAGFATSASAHEVEVNAGDTLWTIAERENVTVDSLIELNNLSGDLIRPNDKLIVHHTHVVKAGESLWDIAKEYNVTIDELQNWNKLDSAIIQPGEELIVQNAKNIDSSKSSSKKQVADTKVKQTTTSPKANSKELTVTATAYTANCEGCSGTTATGINLHKNPSAKVIAVDPSVIPLGSKVYVEGYGEAIAGDTGGAIKGNKIDLFIPSKSAALDWGRKEVRIKVLE
ncbi:3D (Asp-Asp-Asp) domain-containing protein [Metabacillus crassostreae]|uniref:3D domain-containing protein n=1 Tax=Metabacillus crassostreae TaxID=929098 RepID=UPI00195D8283|nr:3D domain-containing protein [Metabacillus crassostreae]MBM7605524.1 3D (Asp-Asp-Asp) domain-containing protein [Metabacillus crassostreae]